MCRCGRYRIEIDSNQRRATTARIRELGDHSQQFTRTAAYIEDAELTEVFLFDLAEQSFLQRTPVAKMSIDECDLAQEGLIFLGCVIPGVYPLGFSGAFVEHENRVSNRRDAETPRKKKRNRVDLDPFPFFSASQRLGG